MVFHPSGKLFETVNGVVVKGDPVLAEGAFVVCREATMLWAIRHAEIHITTGEAVRIVWPFLLTKGLETRGGENIVEIVL